MFGDGIVSFGVTPSPAVSCRNAKWSAKIVSSSRTLSCTRSAAVLNSMSPDSLWNWTLILSSAGLIPPSR